MVGVYKRLDLEEKTIPKSLKWGEGHVLWIVPF